MLEGERKGRKDVQERGEMERMRKGTGELCALKRERSVSPPHPRRRCRLASRARARARRRRHCFMSRPELHVDSVRFSSARRTSPTKSRHSSIHLIYLSTQPLCSTHRAYSSVRIPPHLPSLRTPLSRSSSTRNSSTPLRGVNRRRNTGAGGNGLLPTGGAPTWRGSCGNTCRTSSSTTAYRKCKHGSGRQAGRGEAATSAGMRSVAKRERVDTMPSSVRKPMSMVWDVSWMPGGKLYFCSPAHRAGSSAPSA